MCLCYSYSSYVHQMLDKRPWRQPSACRLGLLCQFIKCVEPSFSFSYTSSSLVGTEINWKLKTDQIVHLNGLPIKKCLELKRDPPEDDEEAKKTHGKLMLENTKMKLTEVRAPSKFLFLLSFFVSLFLSLFSLFCLKYYFGLDLLIRWFFSAGGYSM